MSKYAPLWAYINEADKPQMQLTFDEVKNILGFEIDHSFLTFKKELLTYGYQVGKISMKNKTVEIIKQI